MAFRPLAPGLDYGASCLECCSGAWMPYSLLDGSGQFRGDTYFSARQAEEGPTPVEPLPMGLSFVQTSSSMVLFCFFCIGEWMGITPIAGAFLRLRYFACSPDKSCSKRA